jgi:hypothetical protein
MKDRSEHSDGPRKVGLLQTSPLEEKEGLSVCSAEFLLDLGCLTNRVRLDSQGPGQ